MKLHHATSRVLFVSVLFCVGIALAACFDGATARWLRSNQIDAFFHQHRHLREILKLPGFFPATIIIAANVFFLHPARWRASVFVLIAGATSAINQALKWTVGRYRPFSPPDGSGRLAPFEFHPFPHDGKNLCFPSGHACLAFATAAALGMLWPRGRWAFYACAAVVAVERVAENAHWLSDAVAAAGIGIGGACLIRWWLGNILLPREAHGRTNVEQRAIPLAGGAGLQRAGEYSDAADPRSVVPAEDRSAV